MTFHPISALKVLGSRFRVSRIWFLAAIFLAFGQMPGVYGYAEGELDRDTTGLDRHSVFHFELCLVLAAFSGFNLSETDLICTANQATDIGQFQGYKFQGGKGTKVILQNTGRITTESSILLHFPTRDASFTAPGYFANTCDYFQYGDVGNPYAAPCSVDENGQPITTVGLLKNYVFGLPGDLPPENVLPQNEQGEIIQPNTPENQLILLGILAHQISDSYSHEPCYQHAAIRRHLIGPFAPDACRLDYHTTPEGDFGSGRPYARAAALEVFKLFKEYRQEPITAYPEPFIDAFLDQPSDCSKAQFAIDTFRETVGINKRINLSCPS